MKHPPLLLIYVIFMNIKPKCIPVSEIRKSPSGKNTVFLLTLLTCHMMFSMFRLSCAKKQAVSVVAEDVWFGSTAMTHGTNPDALQGGAPVTRGRVHANVTVLGVEWSCFLFHFVFLPLWLAWSDSPGPELASCSLSALFLLQLSVCLRFLSQFLNPPLSLCPCFSRAPPLL